MAIMRLSNAELHFGSHAILDGVDFVIEKESELVCSVAMVLVRPPYSEYSVANTRWTMEAAGSTPPSA